MASRLPVTNHIRKLRNGEAALVAAHYGRLSDGDRQRRFAHAVSPQFYREHADRALAGDGLVYGYFEDGVLRGLGEVAPMEGGWADAEAAFSVEEGWQQRGVGSRLFRRVLRAAVNRGARRLFMLCLPENRPMRRLARKHHAVIEIARGEVAGIVEPSLPPGLSLMREMMEDGYGALAGLVDEPARPRK